MISNRSQEQAFEVLEILVNAHVTKIHTRGALDRVIEYVKFPETRSKGFSKKTMYKNQQYDPIRNWLDTMGYISNEFDGYRYHYTVNYAKQYFEINNV